jgi:hypothetical protein
MNVLLISALCNNDSCTRDFRKPDIIAFCEMTKDAVDRADKMLVKYQCARNSWYWPMVTFCIMLNVGSINAFVLCHGKINP